MSLESRWLAQLEALRTRDRYRGLASPQGIDFSSNDYLGYAKLRRSDHDGLSRSGTASRLLRGHHEVWDEVEGQLANWHKSEAALMFTSGYAANEGLLATVIEPGDWVASDECNHASIIDGLRLAKADRFVFRHNDVNQLEDGLRRAAQARGKNRQLFLVTESLYSMEGDFVWAELADLVRRYDVNWIVDEAHTTGCLGKTGAGMIAARGWRERVLATVHTGGKALGVPGAYVACSRLLREVLINRCTHFICTTALPPQIGAWWLDMLPRVQADHESRRRLARNAMQFRGTLRETSALARRASEGSTRSTAEMPESYIVSIVLGQDAAATAAARQLQVAGYDIRPIRPPTVPEGTARLRVSIHADHTQDDLQAVASLLAEVLS